MRKSAFLPCFALCLIANSLLAQNTSPYWSLAGNSTATASSKLGTTNNVPLRLVTNNLERMRIDPAGKVSIGSSNASGRLTVFNNGSAPAASWISSTPLFVGFGENAAGSSDHILALASNTISARPVFLGRKSRGTLAAPAAVQNNDYLMSLFASGYDGSNFQSPAAVDFFADGVASSGSVPARISFSTGANASSRTERVKIGSTGNINFNNGQMFLHQSTGSLGLNTITPDDFYRLHIEGGDHQGILVNVGYYVGTGIQVTGNPGIVSYGGEGIEGSEGIYARGKSGVWASGQEYGIQAYVDAGGSYAGYFSGDIYTTGAYTSSDQKLKQHIKAVPSGLEIIARLQPKTYEYRHDGNFKLMNFPAGTHYGLVAQEVESVLPNLVKESKFNTKIAQMKSDHAASGQSGNKQKMNSITGSSPADVVDYKAVNYTELIPILIRAVQEQQEQITQLQKTIAQLLENNSAAKALRGALSQNTPNPAVGTTNISYTLPQGAHQSKLVIVDNAGRTVSVIPLSASGTVSVNTAGWSSGIYQYSLIVDDRPASTRQLVIAR